MFQIKRYKFLSRKHGIIEKNYSNENCRVQKDLFINLISLTLNGMDFESSRSSQDHVDYLKWNTLLLIPESKLFLIEYFST